jgi:hypothetical protein
MLDPVINTWVDRGWSADAGEAPRRHGELRVALAWRANPNSSHGQETSEVNVTAGG